MFAVNVLGAEQLDLAFNFFKSHEREGNTIGGQPFEDGPATGSPLLTICPAWWECKLVDEVAKGDHNLNYGG